MTALYVLCTLALGSIALLQTLRVSALVRRIYAERTIAIRKIAKARGCIHALIPAVHPDAEHAANVRMTLDEWIEDRSEDFDKWKIQHVVEPLPVGRAPTRPPTAAELKALRSLQERPMRIEICYPESEARPNYVSDIARREIYCERIRRIARWARSSGAHDWAAANRELAATSFELWPVELQMVNATRTMMGEERCAEVYRLYVNGDPCEAPCGERSCGASGGACRKGIPR